MPKAPTPEFYKGMRKGERAARERFFQMANTILTDTFKLVPIEQAPANSLVGPTTTYVAATNVGKLTLYVGDDGVMTRFELPELARHRLECNPLSGKWNHHAFFDAKAHGLAVASGRWSLRYTEDVLAQLTAGLWRVLARPWTTTESTMTVAEAEALGAKRLACLTAMGNVITLSDWTDRDAQIAQYLAEVVDADGNRPAWLVESCERWVSHLPDWELHARLKEHRALMSENKTCAAA